MVCLIFDWYLSTLGVVNPDLSRMWYERRNAFLGPKVAYIYHAFDVCKLANPNWATVLPSRDLHANDMPITACEL